MQRRMGRKLPYKLQYGRPFLLIFLAMIDRTLLLSNYLGNSFPQTEQPPKSELPSHSSLSRTFQYFVPFSNYPPTYCRGDGPALGARVAALQPLPHPLRLRAEAGDSAPGRGGALQAAQPQRGAGPREHQQVLVA